MKNPKATSGWINWSDAVVAPCRASMATHGIGVMPPGTGRGPGLIVNPARLSGSALDIAKRDRHHMFTAVSIDFIQRIEARLRTSLGMKWAGIPAGEKVWREMSRGRSGLLFGLILRPVQRMSLEACPNCGYAVSIIEHQCRHCAGASRVVPKFPKLDARTVSNAILLGGILSAIVYWAFFAH